MMTNTIEKDLFLLTQENELGRGQEGTVYRCGDLAVKVFDCFKPIAMELSLCSLFCQLPTKRAIVPRKILTHQDKYSGYISEFVPNDCLAIDLNVDCLIESLVCLENDILLFTQNHINIEDVSVDNYCVNDTGIYSIDYGLSKMDDSLSFEQLIGKNRRNLSFFFGSVLSRELGNFEFIDLVIQNLEISMFSPLNIEKIREVLSSCSTIREYAEVISKQKEENHHTL